MSTLADEQQVAEFIESARQIEAEVGQLIVGQQHIVRQVLIALLGGGHVLLEGVPGLGKTMLIRTLGEVLDLQFKRVQFTPDLMPADIVGTNLIAESEAGKGFQFQQGPIFANLVLADEINRATPKTQSALLEAMQEQTVTVANISHRLPRPFFVLATQNPIDMEGTYPLPEAQLDRFFFKLKIAYPSVDELMEVLNRTTAGPGATLKKVADGSRVVKMQELGRQVPINKDITNYTVRLVMASQPSTAVAPKITKDYVRYGSSPRGAQTLVLAGKIRALLEGRYNVSLEDIKAVAHDALRHRIILNFEGEAEGITTDQVIDSIIQELAEIV